MISEVVPMTTKFVFENQSKINFHKLSRNNFGNTKERKKKRSLVKVTSFKKLKFHSK